MTETLYRRNRIAKTLTAFTDVRGAFSIGLPMSSSSDFLVRRALSLFEREPSRRWTVEDIAAALGVSRAVLARRFAAALSEPPLRVLTAVRMRRARELLRESDDGLAAIADAVGYDSEFAFSRAFKRVNGVAPVIFRRQSRATCLAA